jgi:hypothetical protein
MPPNLVRQREELRALRSAAAAEPQQSAPSVAKKG